MNYEPKILPRLLQDQIIKNLFKGKIIILYGARQVGKTTLCKEILKKYPQDSKYINCELLQNKTALETTNDKKLKDFLGDSKLIILDESQKIKNIGLILKIIADTFPKIQIIATGSSSFELANKTSEPLTGRARRYLLYPFSIQEIKKETDLFDLSAKLENILRFGTYPSVFNRPEDGAMEELLEISSNYLYKDILEFSGLRKPDLVLNLLKALSLQLGNEVSMSELANLLGKNSHTIESYLTLLEQCFIVFRVKSFSRNLRKEISKTFKVYFYDLGIRNSLIQNFNQLELRTDVGALWENFCVLERMKRNNNNRVFANYYFWRTYDQKEIDYIEERNGKLSAFEFKWKKDKQKPPQEFLDTYKNSEFKIINKDNYWDFAG
ncbi:ATP-binding protein [Patescibacteria group bacterium]|nr:ATP-binding protein [Patescibacteria group bacterium]MCG2808798.1 ATP-binding protein [Candidatus Portnoybacteria bacterium]